MKSRMKLEEHAKRMEIELSKANGFIQFQHNEFTTKVKELEDTRQKLISMLMSNQKSILGEKKPIKRDL